MSHKGHPFFSPRLAAAVMHLAQSLTQFKPPCCRLVRHAGHRHHHIGLFATGEVIRRRPAHGIHASILACGRGRNRHVFSLAVAVHMVCSRAHRPFFCIDPEPTGWLAAQCRTQNQRCLLLPVGSLSARWPRDPCCFAPPSQSWLWPTPAAFVGKRGRSQNGSWTVFVQ